MHTPARRRSPVLSRQPTRGGFTLIEVLVVVGLLAVLASLTVPAILKAIKNGKRSRAQADMQTILTAMEAYHQDFQDYPRFTATGTGYVATAGNWDARKDRGAILLCRALIGPADDYIDGATGLGFRTRVGIDSGGNRVYQGRTYSYLPPDKFHVSPRLSKPLGVPTTVTTPPSVDASAKMLDVNGNPILYYPANPGPANVTATNGFFNTVDPTGATRQTSRYNLWDNDQVEADGTTAARPLFSVTASMGDLSNSKFGLLAIMGDHKSAETATKAGPNCLGSSAGTDFNGQIDANETATYTGPFIVWMAGLDGNYGLTARNTTENAVKTEAIANFQIPQNLLR